MGLSAAYIGQAHAIIRRALNQAVKWELVKRNVAILASPPRRQQAQITSHSADEVQQIINAAREGSTQLAAFITLAALTGARRGELAGLRWSDVSMPSQTLHIPRSAYYTPTEGIRFKTPKTGHHRRVSLDDLSIAVITEQMERLLSQAAAIGIEEVADPFLFFGDPTGAFPWHVDTPSKAFRNVCDSLGMNWHLHQLRHFSATQLIAAGVDVRTVSGRLGHADASVTLRVYAHALEAQDRAAAAHLGRILRP